MFNVLWVNNGMPDFLNDLYRWVVIIAANNCLRGLAPTSIKQGGRR